MDFVKSHLEKMKLWPVEHFWLTFFPDQHWSGADLEKKWAKSVQLVRVSFFRSDFLQNPYFRNNLSIILISLCWSWQSCFKIILLWFFFETTIGPFLIRKFAHPQGVWTFAILAKKQRLQKDEREIRLTTFIN